MHSLINSSSETQIYH